MFKCIQFDNVIGNFRLKKMVSFSEGWSQSPNQ